MTTEDTKPKAKPKPKGENLKKLRAAKDAGALDKDKGSYNPPKYKDMKDGKYKGKKMADLIENKVMKHVDFTGSDLTRTDFRGFNLQGCIFRNCKLEETNFAGADLRWADFRGAEIDDAILFEENESGSIINPANLFEAQGVTI